MLRLKRTQLIIGKDMKSGYTVIPEYPLKHNNTIPDQVPLSPAFTGQSFM
jgi:hypothetical protein